MIYPEKRVAGSVTSSDQAPLEDEIFLLVIMVAKVFRVFFLLLLGNFDALIMRAKYVCN